MKGVVAAMIASLLSIPTSDRRTVDVVKAGDEASEAAHGYAGVADSAGWARGDSFRRTSGWMRYGLATFDDTEVTIACTFVGGDSVPRTFVLVVEDSVIAIRTLAALTAEGTVLEIPVPFSVTKGRSHIAVTLRARGAATPALRELRVVQDHNEDSGAVR